MSDIRYDRLYGRHVIIAPERMHRPDAVPSAAPTVLTDPECPFCEGNESMTPPEIYAIREMGSRVNEPGWKTRVVPNLYKAVQIETPHRRHFGWFEHEEGFGAHEVIIDTPTHHTSMLEWGIDQTALWLQTLGTRVADLRNDRRIAYLSIFKNEGAAAGATQAHTHTQLIGLPVVPETQRAYFEHATAHFQEYGTALLSTMLKHESSEQKRIVASEGDFTAFCPYASTYPFETIIAARSLQGQIDTLGMKHLQTVATLLQQVLERLKAQLGVMAFNLEIATPPLHDADAWGLLEHTDAMFPFMIRITPRLYRLGGFEVATQMMINPMAPEEAAKLLRGHADA